MDDTSLSLPQLEQQLSARSEEAQRMLASLTEAKQQIETAEITLAQAKKKVSDLEVKLNQLVGCEPGPQKPLRTFVSNVLANSNEPLSVNEIAELVLEAGYKSKTSNPNNFKNMIMQVLFKSDEFKRVTRGKTRPARYDVMG